MSLGTLCSRIVATASPRETIRTAASRMAINDVGTLVVLEGPDSGAPVGILTDRDITIRSVAAGLDPDVATIGTIMTQPVQTVDEHTPLEDVIAQMARHGTRRIVVMNDAGRMAGLISLDDILHQLAEDAGEIGRLLSRQEPLVSA